MCEPVGVATHRLRTSALQPELTSAPGFALYLPLVAAVFPLSTFVLCSACFLLVGDEVLQRGGNCPFPAPLRTLVATYTPLCLTPDTVLMYELFKN